MIQLNLWRTQSFPKPPQSEQLPPKCGLWTHLRCLVPGAAGPELPLAGGPFEVGVWLRWNLQGLSVRIHLKNYLTMLNLYLNFRLLLFLLLKQNKMKVMHLDCVWYVNHQPAGLVWRLVAAEFFSDFSSDSRCCTLSCRDLVSVSKRMTSSLKTLHTLRRTSLDMTWRTAVRLICGGQKTSILQRNQVNKLCSMFRSSGCNCDYRAESVSTVLLNLNVCKNFQFCGFLNASVDCLGKLKNWHIWYVSKQQCLWSQLKNKTTWADYNYTSVI